MIFARNSIKHQQLVYFAKKKQIQETRMAKFEKVQLKKRGKRNLRWKKERNAGRRKRETSEAVK